MAENERRFVGRRVMYCPNCGVFAIAKDGSRVCPRCGEWASVYRCIRCGHIWTPMKESPRVCPKCRTPYWNRERVRGDGR